MWAWNQTWTVYVWNRISPKNVWLNYGPRWVLCLFASRVGLFLVSVPCISRQPAGDDRSPVPRFWAERRTCAAWWHLYLPMHALRLSAPRRPTRQSTTGHGHPGTTAVTMIQQKKRTICRRSPSRTETMGVLELVASSSFSTDVDKILNTTCIYCNVNDHTTI